MFDYFKIVHCLFLSFCVSFFPCFFRSLFFVDSCVLSFHLSFVHVFVCFSVSFLVSSFQFFQSLFCLFVRLPVSFSLSLCLQLFFVCARLLLWFILRFFLSFTIRFFRALFLSVRLYIHIWILHVWFLFPHLRVCCLYFPTATRWSAGQVHLLLRPLRRPGECRQVGDGRAVPQTSPVSSLPRHTLTPFFVYLSSYKCPVFFFFMQPTLLCCC